MLRFLLILIFLGYELPGHTQGIHFTYSPAAEDVYQDILSLRFSDAEQGLNRLRKEDPQNLVRFHLENYLDFFVIFISEDPDAYARLKGNRDYRLRALQKGDPKSPWYLYVQADVRLQWALLRVRFGEVLGAFNEVSKAYQLLERNQKQFPDFLPNYKDLGILHAMVGTIPDQYQWGVRLLSGLQGSIEQGRTELERILQNPGPGRVLFEQETAVLYAYLLLHLQNEPEAAWAVTQKAGLKPDCNPLHCFIQANIAMRTDRNDRALDLLVNRPQSEEYADFPYLHFMEGMVRLRKLEKGAGRYFQTFLEQARGENFIKEAYQKMAWAALIDGNPRDYRQHMANCLTEGGLASGPDKNAFLEAKSGRQPPLALLKARLLFDGGYHQKAYNELIVHADTRFSDPYHRLEYSYRMGRVLHGLKRYNAALLYYRKTIDRGQTQPFYFACNAALQSGLIHEQQALYEAASRSFQLCLSLKPEEYRIGLHQAAKAGLRRLEDR